MSRVTFSKPPTIEYSFYLSGYRRFFNKEFPYKKEPSLFDNPRYSSIEAAIEAAKRQAIVINQEEIEKGNYVGLQGDVSIHAFVDGRPKMLFYLTFEATDVEPCWQEQKAA